MGSVTGPVDDRQRIAQQAPPPHIDLSAFPFDQPPTAQPLYRAHSKRNSAWWFSSSGKGRFDLQVPRGTCYAADDIAPALRERLGPSFVGGGRIPASLADDAVVTEITAPSSVRGANLEHSAVADYPITGELTAMPDYTVTQAWAEAFADADLDAIHYRGRFSHTYGVACWALFDETGSRPYPIGLSIGGRDACALAKIRVLPAPPTDPSTLRVLRPPS